MDYIEAIENVKKYSDLVNKEMHPEMIILYGSYAKGTAREDSDIDVAVIYDKVPDEDFLKKYQLLYKLRRDIDCRIEPKLIERENDESGFYETVIKTGKIVLQN